MVTGIANCTVFIASLHVSEEDSGVSVFEDVNYC
jgi:hypothetical protein